MNSHDATSIYDDAQTYDLIHVPDKRLDEKFYRSLANQGESILEIACGSGRLTIPLAQSGLKMTGLDLSEAMLAEGRKKSKALDLQLEWVHGDARKFNLNRKFQLIFMPCNSLQHLHQSEDVIMMLNSVREHLRPDGIFACDIFKPDLKILSRDPQTQFHVLNYSRPDGSQISLDERTQYDDITQVAHIEWLHHDIDKTLLKRDTLQMRQFFPQEIRQLFRDAGFRIRDLYGNWQLEPMSSKNFKQIIVAEPEHSESIRIKA